MQGMSSQNVNEKVAERKDLMPLSLLLCSLSFSSAPGLGVPDGRSRAALCLVSSGVIQGRGDACSDSAGQNE